MKLQKKCVAVYLLKAMYVALMCVASLSLSCLSDKDETLVLPGNEGVDQSGNDVELPGTTLPSGETGTGTSATFSRFVQDGFSLTVPIQSIPQTSSGSVGQVAFSVERTDALPLPLPEYLTGIGRAVKIEPFNFTFQYPVTLNIPVGSDFDPNTMNIYSYNELSGSWEEVPVSGFSGNTAVINTLSLGYYIIARDTRTPGSLGGIRLVHPQSSKSYFYTLTILEYDGNGNGNSIRGKVVRTLPIGKGSPDKTTYIPFIPKGYYAILVSREERSSITSAPLSVEYYTPPFQVNVSNTLTRSGNGLNNWGEYNGWADISLTSSGDWNSGRPEAWSPVTVTYGTGKFQATLTWVNSTTTCDYDLHLTGPNSLHVYFGAKQGGSFELDRDWLNATGNATENIYSINNTFPTGSYTVSVRLYSGQTGKEFNCRILLDGKVVSSTRSSIASTGTQTTIYNFTVN
ncbi:MAG: hypothetical protein LBC40_08690 [Dysgonamonadaceae bacterium]|jgi:hypothetical protein|nr:hypothetical protein [Dysgonamonadaceae bacterium]